MNRLRRLLIYIFVIVGGFFAVVFVLDVFPVKFAEWALASLNKDQHIGDVLDHDSKFVFYLRKNWVGTHIWFRSGNPQNWEKSDRVCGSIDMFRPHSNVEVQYFSSYKSDPKNLVWWGTHTELKNALVQNQENRRGTAILLVEQLGKCSVMETTFMPFFPYRCTVSVVYDSDLKVKSWEKPRCWD
jgi:hypothetical protein